MAQIGRISGPLLEENLIRNNIDLSVLNDLNSTPVLYLDVDNKRIGVDLPGTLAISNLTISQTLNTTGDIIATNSANIDNFAISQGRIDYSIGDIYIDAGQKIIYSGFGTDNIVADNTRISTYTNNTNLNLDPNGVGTVEFLNNLEVDGSIHASGNITAPEHIIIGSDDKDNVSLVGKTINSLIPSQGSTFSIGSPAKRFADLQSRLFNGQNITVGSLNLDGLNDLGQPVGNIFYVAQNGSDTNVGNHPQGPFRSIKRALAAADGSTAGPVVIHILPGTYEEELPLVVPTNVTVSGEDLRNVIVKPAVGYENNDVFLLNGETTIQNLTIKKDLQNPLPPHIVDPNPQVNAFFGYSVSTSKSYCIVGARQYDDGETDSGRAYIYSNLTGNLLYTLVNPTAYSTGRLDYFGVSVSISESYAIVGAFQEDDSGGASAGKAYIYDLSTLTPGTITNATFVLDNPNPYGTSGGDFFGASVSISESYAIVGASNSDEGQGESVSDPGGYSGKGYIYDLSTLTPGTITNATFVLDNPNAFYQSKLDRFGTSVSISESYAIVGAWGEDDSSGGNSGKGYIYDLSTLTPGTITNATFVLDNPNQYGTSGGDYFGISVSISESYAIVGAQNEDDANGTNSGKAYIYDLSTLTPGTITNATFVLDNPNAYDTSASDFFGISVSISESYAIVGAQYEDDANGTSSGKAYIFDTSTGNLLRTLDNLNPYGTSAGDFFGASVSISESHAIVGARNEDVTYNGNEGAAYIYNISNTAAFSFAPNAIVSTRSPYIQNCSVILTPPLNFSQEFYYQNFTGALVDGAEVDSNSNEASMLFHSCTFITPYHDALIATNGARVEWLNSFTYFANRGIYAYNGTTGHLSSDGSTIKYGAEIRSIGSACVYGNYGIVGDGSEVLVYAINHNLAYIGTGTSTDNDPNNVIPSNKVVKLNNAKIYYQSQDHTGNYSVGDNFFVNLESGETSLGTVGGVFSNFNSLIIRDANNNTEIYPDRISVEDIRIEDNTFYTLAGNLNLDSASTNNEILFNANVRISDLLVDNDVNIDGQLNFFVGESDNLLIFDGSPISHNLVPNINRQYDLGNNSKKYNNGFFGQFLSDIIINDNYITTKNLNEDLILRSAFLSNNILLPTANLEIDNDIYVNNEMYFSNGTMVGNLIVNDLTIDNSFVISDQTNINSLQASNGSQFENIAIENTSIFTTISNSDLEILAAGTGLINLEQVRINKNLDVNNNLDFNNNDSINFNLGGILNNKIEIYDNVVETITNDELNLQAITKIIELDNLLIGNATINSNNNITLIADSFNLNNTHGTILPKIIDTGRQNIAGLIAFHASTNTFEGYSNKIIKFGGVISEDSSARITTDSQNSIIITFNNIEVGNVNSNNFTLHGVKIDDILVRNNKISTFSNNNDLLLQPNGAGTHFIENFQITDNSITNLTLNTNTYLDNTGIGFYKFHELNIPHGTTNERLSTAITGDLRFNTQETDLEVYNGSVWQTALGTIDQIPEDDATYLDFEASLILG